MNNAKARKLQYLLISELLDKGSVELILPDGVVLEIGIIQEDEFGETKKADDYCYVVATRQGKSTMLDSYNLGLQFEDDEDSIIFEDKTCDQNGKQLRVVEVI